MDYAKYKERTTAIKVLSPVLFFAPDLHLGKIEEVWTDGVVLHNSWKEYIENLIREWEGLVLYVRSLVSTLSAKSNVSSPPFYLMPTSRFWQYQMSLATKEH